MLTAILATVTIPCH